MSKLKPSCLDISSCYCRSEIQTVLPELFIEPPTPKSTSTETEDDNVIRDKWTSTRHSSYPFIDRMHSSSSDNFQRIDNPLTREKRSQSFPLSLDAVALTKKLVSVSDKFEAKVQVTRITRRRFRSLSGSESAEEKKISQTKRHSDLIDHLFSCSQDEGEDISMKVGSPV